MACTPTGVVGASTQRTDAVGPAAGYASPTGGADGSSAEPGAAASPRASAAPSASSPAIAASGPATSVPDPGSGSSTAAEPTPAPSGAGRTGEGPSNAAETSWPIFGFPSQSAAETPGAGVEPSQDYPGYPGYPGLPGPSPTPSAYRSADCTVDDILAPSCGVWWGASPYHGDVRPLEEAVDRPLDIVYTWHGVDQHRVPTAAERRLAEEGRFLHANIEARRFNADGHPVQGYGDIIEGRFDDSLRGQARRIADLGRPFFVTFDHEADANQRYNTRGTPEQFVRAWRHIVDLYRANGADNAVFVWNVTGWKGNLDRLPSLWPGDDYVDWISWEAYNMTGCELQPGWNHVDTFEEALRPAYEWFQNEGPEHGIDADKPVMIGEMGTVPIPGDPAATREWYADIPETLREYERVRAVKLWDGITAPSCDFRVLRNHQATRGYLQASRHRYVTVPHQAREAVDEAIEIADRARKLRARARGEG
ncbi:glycoside hydrolase family 26 protein [Streptomonospora wellingtoniae]|uniref:Glycosyl hydrolase family 26 n=1 Tax=Streptomonospora wellingtoniae TaxID=3075544 RepID=A0ABU2KSK2_9ACTN|nr:glycosyl hydrolase family 26 [Streptomonospora sp. DSM 45055]MDT0302266.1 glycosyl hydrolase family 26 [Streptomonospora sp. DSM 45055]